jgi:hypothetical protein
MVLELGIDTGGVANQHEAHLRVADQRERCRRNHHAWPVVPAHGVERYGGWSTHYRTGLENMTYAVPGNGNPRNDPE